MALHLHPSKLLAPIVVLALTVAAVAAVWLLVDRASASREAQLRVATMKLSLANLGNAPFSADPHAGGSAAASRRAIERDETSLAGGLNARSQPGVPDRLLAAGSMHLAAIEPVVASIYRTALEKGGLAGAGIRVPELQGQMIVASAALTGVLDQISLSDATRAAAARRRTKLGATGAMLLLLLAFMFFYIRSVSSRESVERLVAEKESLLGESQIEARTDALTNLANRRALADDLAGAIAEPPGANELLLAMFDLDGFKQYNDSFGHAAGDALLHRLAGRLAAATKHAGPAYRMGGDEFCVLARCSADALEQFLDGAVAALEDSGESWHIGCSQGAVWIPTEATTESDALKLADERMYANKASRSSASQQVTDALLQMISEQNLSLDEHVERVSHLAGAVAEALGEPEFEVWRVRLAAKLHDVGKTAIPSAILDKPGPPDEREREFIRRHPLIGERIVQAAPALATTAALIRSSHERIDGRGYPDGLIGREIPMGSRIIAVCDAYDAMTADRPYRSAMDSDVAIEELRCNSGTQFDAAVVDAFCNLTTLDQSAGSELHAAPVSA